MCVIYRIIFGGVLKDFVPILGKAYVLAEIF